MPSGFEWREHYEYCNNETLRTYIKCIDILCYDEMFRKVFGEEEGLLALGNIMERIVAKREKD